MGFSSQGSQGRSPEKVTLLQRPATLMRGREQWWEVHKGCEFASQALGLRGTWGVRPSPLLPLRHASHTQVRRGKARRLQREKLRPGSFPQRARHLAATSGTAWLPHPGHQPPAGCRCPPTHPLCSPPTKASFILPEAAAPNIAAALAFLLLSPPLVSCHSETALQQSLSMNPLSQLTSHSHLTSPVWRSAITPTSHFLLGFSQPPGSN